MRIKKVACRSCNAPKLTQSKTAYIYCDFCGTFTDWDFYKAVESANSKMPDSGNRATASYAVRTVL